MSRKKPVATRWEIVPETSRRWRWRVERGGEVAEGEATSETAAYLAADAALDEFLGVKNRVTADGTPY